MLDYTKKELLGILAQLEKISDGLGVLLDSEEERAETSGGEDAETVCDALDEAPRRSKRSIFGARRAA